ncbi:MAG: SUMF1/EgtB/PvdO family nonheme iron enzyme [Kiritimatiellae bacterium]|nr:SUMF1/EgtB/PvdO family nonheme iron enzyme [Kiritimatiellia bacterium]
MFKGNFERFLALTLLALSSSCLFADTPDAADVRRAQEQLRWFQPEAARRALADLKRNPKYEWERHHQAVEALIDNLDEIRNALKSGDPARCAGAVKAVEGYRAAMLANPLLDFDRILCVHRKLGNPRGAFGGRSMGMTGLNAENHMVAPRTGFENEIGVLSNLRGKPEFKPLYKPEDRTSVVRDIDLDFDASRILFTGYRGTNNLFGVYEIKTDFSKLSAQPPYQTPELLSPAEHMDIQWWDACYLPNPDQFVMLGTAAYQFLPCEDGNMPMAVLYRKDRVTGEIRQLTYEQDSDYTPNVTHDGRIIYTRWEYSDQPHYWSRVLMTMNPDGVGQLAMWGSNSFVPTFFYCARSVPGDSHLITMIAGGHHDRAEIGRFFLVDPTLARNYPFRYDPPDRDWGPAMHTLRIPAKTFPKERTGLVHEFPGYGQDVSGDMADPYTMNQFARGKPYFSHPWPLDPKYFLATVKSADDALLGIYLVDVFDNITLIAEADDGIYIEAIPFVPRERPPVIPDRSVKGAKTCSVHVADIYNGPGLAGIPRGFVKKLRLFSYHYNYHKTGGHSKTGLDRVESSWDVKRILGTVDVEEDGSCCFEMPANTPVSLQPLDADGCAVQLMRSWIVGMPGERISCTGCHEDNRTSLPNAKRTIADEKHPQGQKITPADADGVRPWGFANEMFPLVRKYCMTCHGDKEKSPAAKADQGGYAANGLNGKRLWMGSAEEAYRVLHPYIHRPGPESEVTLLPPMDYHASTSPLVQMLRKGHHGVRVAPEDFRKIFEWIDLNCPFYGKWNPPSLAKPDNWVQAPVPDQVKRRLELQIAYAGNDDNPEAEHDRYAAVVGKREIKPVAPSQVKPAEKLTLAGWPMNELQSADAQLGAINELAPVTAKTLVISGGQSITFRRIPAGRFVMGSDSGYPDEFPLSAVTIAKPFWISEMEIQNQQYNVFDPNHDSRYQDEFGKDHVFPGHVGNHRRMPVVRVSWNRAREFCAWLSKTCNVKADLPTEAQWEWAARSGTATPFPWGGLDDDFSRYANFADRDVRYQVVGFNGGGNIRVRHPFRIEQNFPLHEERWQDDWFCLNFTGRANVNRWGLYDMHGNASEWTRSDYVPYPYLESDGRNDGTSGRKKTVRGGSFASRPRDGTSSYRLGYEPWQTVYDVGFRVVLECDE